MSKLQNRGVAALITACAVLLSVLLGANISLNGLRREAVQYYEYGSYDGMRGIEYDLSDMTGNGYNLITVAQYYLEPADERIAAVDRAIEESYHANGPKELYGAVEHLYAAAGELDGALRTQASVEGEHRNQQDKLMANIDGSYRRIKQSPYNDEALRFNQALEDFPANVLGDLVGVKPLELYA